MRRAFRRKLIALLAMLPVPALAQVSNPPTQLSPKSVAQCSASCAPNNATANCPAGSPVVGPVKCSAGSWVANAAAPSGSAGGVLSGTYPNPGMAAGAAATNVGTLGGSLSGTLPSPSVINVLTSAIPPLQVCDAGTNGHFVWSQTTNGIGVINYLCKPGAGGWIAHPQMPLWNPFGFTSTDLANDWPATTFVGYAALIGDGNDNPGLALWGNQGVSWLLLGQVVVSSGTTTNAAGDVLFGQGDGTWLKAAPSGDLNGCTAGGACNLAATQSHVTALSAAALTISGALTASNAKNKGTCTLGTDCAAITVASGAVCTCADTTSAAACKAVVSSTTLTITGTGTDVIAWICL